MAILQNSPLFQQMAREQRQEENLRVLLRQIQRRFGEVSVPIQAKLQGLNIEQLDELLDLPFTVTSLDEFVSFIPSKNGNDSELT